MSVFFNQAFLFGLLGGLGLFLFGMKVMSEGLQKVADDRMRRILSSLTSNRLVGALVGLGVSAIVQSSSVTTVMVVGFVNAGLMSLMQGIGVILGANLGTTVTAQLIAFRITGYALPAIALGAALRLFARNRKWAYAGEILLGVGLLFLALSIMKESFDPVRGSEEFRRFFLAIGDNHLLGVLLGALVTVIVQSSSATIGLTLALATSGLLTFDASVALVLGENIGTAVTSNIAALGTNLTARRTALAHFLFNFVGVTYMLVLFPVFLDIVTAVTPGDPDFVVRTQEQAKALGAAIGDKPFIARHIANTHTLFNLINVFAFLPMAGFLAKMTTLLIRGKEEEVEFHLKYIDNRVLNTPPIALGQARAETRRMAQLALDLLDETIAFLGDLDEKRLSGLEKKEEALDRLQKEITDFLVTLSQKSITQETSRDIAAMMNVVSDLERIGDHCENLWRLGQRKKGERIEFSEAAATELEELAEKTREFLVFTLAAVERRDKTVKEKVTAMEDRIDQMEELFRNNHINRLNTGECGVQQGLIFIDMLHNFEKIGDHTFKLTKALVEEQQ